MKKWLMAMLAVTALLSVACGAKNKETTVENEGDSTPTTAVAGPESAKWGDLDSPCGKGSYSIQADQAGKGADKLYIGVASDKGSEIRPGLNKEMFDGSVAFAQWCNDQGGIGGLQIEPVDIDGKLLSVEQAMATACAEVFMMVGGGFAQDDLEFSGKDGSDFHKCGLADVPGFAVSVKKANSNGQVQPIPHPAYTTGTTWLQDFKKVYPEEAEKSFIVWGDLPSLQLIRDQFKAGAAATDIEVVGDEGYPPVGVADWTPLAQKVIESGAGSMYFVGEPTNLSSLLAKLKEQGWKGKAILETNMYDATLFSAGPNVADGAVIRTAIHMFEEADKWPAVKQFEENLKAQLPDGKQALLGMQSTSAWLLFATAANDCAKANDNVLERNCVLKAASAVSDWTGGGIHGTTDPAGGADAIPPTCNTLIEVKDGKFTRLYPKIGGDDDDLDGFHCPDDAIAKVPEDFGQGAVDPSRPI